MLRILPLFILLLLSSSCINNSSDQSAGVDYSINAQFIDDPVKGLSFKASSGQGRTGSFGYFKCNKGEKVLFKILGLKLGYAICSEKIFVDDLVSSEDGHSPEKVAAIIQTFSRYNSEQYDLSNVIEALPSDTLSDISFASDNATFKIVLENKVSEIDTDYSDLADVTEAKDPAKMRDALDQAITKYSTLSEPLKSHLNQISGHLSDSFDDLYSSGKIITLTGELVNSTGDAEELCYRFIHSNINTIIDGEGPLKIVTQKLALFNSKADFNFVSNTCILPLNQCDDETNTLSLPLPKPVTSQSVNLLTMNQIDDFSLENKMMIKISRTGESSLFSGTFEQIFSWSKSGQTSCLYSINN